MDINSVEEYLQNPGTAIITDANAPVEIRGRQILALDPSEMKAEFQRLFPTLEFAGDLPDGLDNLTQAELRERLLSVSKTAGMVQVGMVTLVRFMMQELGSAAATSQHVISYQNSKIDLMSEEQKALKSQLDLSDNENQYQKDVVKNLKEENSRLTTDLRRLSEEYSKLKSLLAPAVSSDVSIEETQATTPSTKPPPPPTTPPGGCFKICRKSK